MDVGAPSNFARILDLYGDSHEAICAEISGASYSDQQIRQTISSVYQTSDYLLDPHGACGYQALEDGLQADETGVFLETAHPAKFKDTVESVIGKKVIIPDTLKAFMNGKKQSVELPANFEVFKTYLLDQ